jgi:hypothetical protein
MYSMSAAEMSTSSSHRHTAADASDGFVTGRLPMAAIAEPVIVVNPG